MRSRGIQPGFDRGGEFRWRTRARALRVGKERLGDGVRGGGGRGRGGGGLNLAQGGVRVDEGGNNKLALSLPSDRWLSRPLEPALSPCKLPRATVSRDNSPEDTQPLLGNRNVENLEGLRNVVPMGGNISSPHRGSKHLIYLPFSWP